MRKSVQRTSIFSDPTHERRYWVLLVSFIALGVLCAFGLIAYNNPIPLGEPQFWLIAQRRMDAVVAMAIAAVCQALATISFQTVVNNRLITPSIMGFESLYRLIHTSTVFFFGAVGLNNARTLEMFVFQIIIMMALSGALYSWLLRGTANMHSMLLVGIVIGGGLGSITTFMQRLLTPSEFDVLTARMFASVNNAETEFYAVVLPLLAIAGVGLILLARRLNLLSLGRDITVNLGQNHRLLSIGILVLVSVLIATSTSLVGPMTFFGFLVATITYQWAGTYEHRYLFAFACALAFVVLTASYFTMNHIFYAQGSVNIIIELIGGVTFLVVLLRKGRL